MKRIILIFLLFISGTLYAQKMPYADLYKVSITENNKTIVTEIYPVANNPKAKLDLSYYWYSADAIHTTQGGYSGKLLNGQYNEYYLNKNLKLQGTFKNGLKDGVWKSWDEDGKMIETSNWKGGLIVIPKPPSKFWKKVNIFNKFGSHHADTIAKPK